MATTTNLGLTLAPSSEWSTTKYGDFIEALAGSGESNMKKIDTAVGATQATLTAVENALSQI